MAGFDIIATVEVKPDPGSPIMEERLGRHRIDVTEDTPANRARAAETIGHLAYEGACELLGIETKFERLGKLTDAELTALYPGTVAAG